MEINVLASVLVVGHLGSFYSGVGHLDVFQALTILLVYLPRMKDGIAPLLHVLLGQSQSSGMGQFCVLY